MRLLLPVHHAAVAVSDEAMASDWTVSENDKSEIDQSVSGLIPHAVSAGVGGRFIVSFTLVMLLDPVTEPLRLALRTLC